MKELIKDRVEFIFGIITLTVISFNKEMFGEMQIVTVGIEVIIFLILYDICKFVLFSKTLIGPSWLFVSNPIFLNLPSWLKHRLLGFPFSDIKRLEAASRPDARIFILTPNLVLDTQNEPTIEVVKNNLKKGNKYVFLTSDQPDLMRSIDDLLEIHDKSSKISVYTAKKYFISGIAADNIMIIHEPGFEPRGYIQIPEGSGRFWARMSTYATNTYYDNIKDMLHRADPRTSRHDEYSVCRLVAGPPVIFVHVSKTS